MSLAASRWMWEESLQKGNSLLVGHALADHADPDGAAWPSVKTLAKKTRLQPRAVQNHLRTLRDSGEIVVDQWGGRRDGDSTRYRLHGLLPDGTELRAEPPELPPTEIRRARGPGRAKGSEQEDLGSGAPSRTPSPGVTATLLELSRLFAEELIDAGRMGAEGRINAESPDWLDEIEQLVFEQLADPERIERIAKVIRHAASPAWEGVDRPAVLRERFAEIERGMTTDGDGSPRASSGSYDRPGGRSWRAAAEAANAARSQPTQGRRLDQKAQPTQQGGTR